MATDFCIKKVKKNWLYIAIVQLFSALVIAFFCYAAVLSRAEEVRLGKSFYFLVSETDHVEAGAYDARLNGGAGYLLEYDGREYVALAVYLDGEDGEAVQTAMAERGENTRLLQINAEYLYFKTRQEKKDSELYTGALNCLHSCMQILDREIVRLDKGATQQSSKRVLEVLSKQLEYLGKEYETTYTACAEVCQETGARLRELASDTIYGKDLRYLLCELSTKYLELTEAFAL